jgi:hypothetical protein
VAWVPSGRCPVMLTSAPGCDMLSVGVGHEIKPLSLMGRADARSTQIGSPDGISIVFQVSSNSGEPFRSIACRNLFSKDNWRAELGDEAVKSGPEVSFVEMAAPPPDDRKRLTGWRACPDGPVVGPAGEAQGVAPSSDSGEQVDLSEAFEVGSPDIDNAPLVDDAIGDQPGRDQVLQPSRQEGIVLVIVDAHFLGSVMSRAQERRRCPEMT